jgi:P pilus assembly chaperone PapD
MRYIVMKTHALTISPVALALHSQFTAKTISMEQKQFVTATLENTSPYAITISSIELQSQTRSNTRFPKDAIMTVSAENSIQGAFLAAVCQHR